MTRPTHKILIVAALLLPAAAAPVPAETEDFSTLLMRGTVKVANPKSTGTGFVLTQPGADATKKERLVLVTAAHVFEKMAGNEASVIFRTREAEGVYKKRPLKLNIRLGDKPMWTKHPTEDVAVIAIEPPAGADVPRIGVDLLATDEALKKHAVAPGNRVSFLGYPHQVEGNEAGFSILRSGPIATFPLWPTKTNKKFMVSANTFEGDSGSPVCLAERRREPGKSEPQEVRLILGLVIQHYFYKEESRLVYSTSSMKHLLGLGVVIQAPFISETLERLPKPAEGAVVTP
jgi:hypothetical protein